MTKKVLFVGYGAGHIRTLIPVVQHILVDPATEIEPVVLALTTARSEAEAAGIRCLGFYDLGPLDRLAEYWGRKLAGQEEANPAVPYHESIAYLGRSYADLIATEGETVAAELYAEKGRAAFLPILTALRALDDLGIDAVITTNSPRAERAFLEAARLTGRPSIAIWSSLASHEIEWIGRSGYTTYVCVDSPYAIAQMQRAGRSPNEIVLTGNPQYDSLYKRRDPADIASVRAAHGWEPDDKILLFAQQNEPKYHPFTGVSGDPTLPETLNSVLIDALKRCKEKVRLCVRYHPNQTPLPLPRDPRITQSSQSEDLAALLHSVDSVFTCSSTVAYQGAIIGKPIIQGMFSVFSDDVNFSDIAGARQVTDLAEFDNIWQELAKGILPLPNLSMGEAESAAEKVVRVLKEVLS